MAIGHINIGKLNFTFVFRHRYEKGENALLHKFTMWSEWQLGFFFRRMQIVGKKNFRKIKEWDKNLVHMYMFGVNLLWCKAWFTVDRGGMSLELKKAINDED